MCLYDSPRELAVLLLNPWPRIGPWVPAILVAIAAGGMDWRFRRIPNWLTVSGAALGIMVNTALFRWAGLKTSLQGMLLGLALLLPFVLVRSLGAGDWKLAGALGASLGPGSLLGVLFASILVAGVMALAVIVWKGRLKHTLVNIGRMLGALFNLRMPGMEVSLDNPESTKIPFGVAVAVAVVLYGIAAAMGKA
ncbi:MAG TPA: A24 family peptidase [Terriglobales bacterium]|nr:A24 family peptidase [Terriglobales bacterium]